MFLDAHCHLDLDHFKDDIDAVVARAKDAGVGKIITNGGIRKDNEASLALAKRFKEVECMLGIDPHYPAADIEAELAFIEEHINEVCAIGEIGLDHYHFHDPREWKAQEQAFEACLELASRHRLAVEVHTRNAEERVFEILPSYSCKIVLHCFLKSKLASRALERGWMVSLPTVKSKDRESIIALLPSESLFCETDSPFLWQQGRNEPANVLEVYREIAARKGQTLEAVRDTIWRNAQRTFAFKK